ncbi:hypothetical protein ACFRFJ_16360, partial [Streptomyces hydrogenans]
MVQGNNTGQPKHGPDPEGEPDKVRARAAARLRGFLARARQNVQQNKLRGIASRLGSRVRAFLPGRGRGVREAFMQGVAFKLGSGAVSAIILWYT